MHLNNNLTHYSSSSSISSTRACIGRRAVGVDAAGATPVEPVLDAMGTSGWAAAAAGLGVAAAAAAPDFDFVAPFVPAALPASLFFFASFFSFLAAFFAAMDSAVYISSVSVNKADLTDLKRERKYLAPCP